MDASEIKELLYEGEILWGSTFRGPNSEGELIATIRLWQMTIGDLQRGVVERAMVAWPEHFAPTLAELREATLKQMREESGQPLRKTADEAHGALIQLIKRHGWTNPERALEGCEAFDPALTEFVTRWGGTFEAGWTDLCTEIQDPPTSTQRGQIRDAFNLAAVRLERDNDVAPPAIAEYQRQMQEIRARVDEVTDGED